MNGRVKALPRPYFGGMTLRRVRPAIAVALFAAALLAACGGGGGGGGGGRPSANGPAGTTIIVTIPAAPSLEGALIQGTLPTPPTTST